MWTICKARPSSINHTIAAGGGEEENTQKWMLTTLFHNGERKRLRQLEMT